MARHGAAIHLDCQLSETALIRVLSIAKIGIYFRIAAMNVNALTTENLEILLTERILKVNIANQPEADLQLRRTIHNQHLMILVNP